MNATDDAALESAHRHRREIARIVRAYAHDVDRRDYGHLGTLLSDEAELVVEEAGAPLVTIAGADRITDAIRAGHRRCVATSHLLGQISIDVDGDGDVATAESYCHAHHLDVDAPGVARVMVLRYLDRFERTDRWRIRRRHLVSDWTEYRLTSPPDRPDPDGPRPWSAHALRPHR